jgi:hypothetical protein
MPRSRLTIGTDRLGRTRWSGAGRNRPGRVKAPVIYRYQGDRELSGALVAESAKEDERARDGVEARGGSPDRVRGWLLLPRLAPYEAAAGPPGTAVPARPCSN